MKDRQSFIISIICKKVSINSNTVTKNNWERKQYGPVCTAVLYFLCVFVCKELLFGYIFQVQIVFAKPVVLAIKNKAKFHLVTHAKQDILFIKKK